MCGRLLAHKGGFVHRSLQLDGEMRRALGEQTSVTDRQASKQIMTSIENWPMIKRKGTVITAANQITTICIWRVEMPAALEGLKADFNHPT